MFFYLYAIIELLAIFLDSNVIPTANVSYPVRVSLCALVLQFGTHSLRHSGLQQYIPASS